VDQWTPDCSLSECLGEGFLGWWVAHLTALVGPVAWFVMVTGRARDLLRSAPVSPLRLVPAAVLLVACGGASPGVDVELLDAADASGSVDSDLAQLTALFVEGSPIEVATALPAGCAAATSSSSNTPTSGQVLYHFAQCALPGLGVVSGDVQLGYDVTGPTLHLDVQASALQVDRATVASWNASADVTAAGTARTMVWQSVASGTTIARQTTRAFHDDANATLKWSVGASCLDLDGQVGSTFDASDGSQLSFSSTLSSFVACETACPQSGSEVRAELVSGNFVRLQYAADGLASYTNEKGQTFDFVPACAQ